MIGLMLDANVILPPETTTTEPSPEALHRSFEKLVANFADANPSKPVHRTTLRELGLWSEREALLKTREAMVSDHLYAVIAITSDGRAVLLEHDPSQYFDIRANLSHALVAARDAVHRPAPAAVDNGCSVAEAGPAVQTAQDKIESAALLIGVDSDGNITLIKDRYDVARRGPLVPHQEPHPSLTRDEVTNLIVALRGRRR